MFLIEHRYSPVHAVITYLQVPGGYRMQSRRGSANAAGTAGVVETLRGGGGGRIHERPHGVDNLCRLLVNLVIPTPYI